MNEADADGARRAALALHALSPTDRRWLLERLDAVQRERVRPLLHELDALGIRFDSADVAALAVPASATAPVVAPRDWRTLLPDEPDWAIAALHGEGVALTAAARQALRDAAERRLAGAGGEGAPLWKR